jgi:hypothetical protein
MASMDDNKRKYSTDGAEEEVPPKKQKTIGSDDIGDDHSNDGDDHADNDDDGDDEGDDDGDPSSSSSSTDDDYSSEPEEEVSSEGEMNIPTGSEEKLLIQQGRSDEEESCRYFSDDY